MDSWSSYNAVQAGEILPDPVHHTAESSDCVRHLTGYWVQGSPAVQTSLDPVRTLVRAMLRRPGDYQPLGCLCIHMDTHMYLYVSLCVLLCL